MARTKKTRAGREGIQDQFRSLIREAHTLIDSVDRSAAVATPPDGGWSIAECIDHLNETARLYLPELTEAIEQGRAQGLIASAGAAERTLLGRFVAWTQEPPARFRMKTFSEIEPDTGHDPQEITRAFEALHEELIVRINEASDLDWKKIKLRSVLDRRLKLSLGDWFHFLAAHGRRHLWQARQVKDELGTGEAPEEMTAETAPGPEPGRQTPTGEKPDRETAPQDKRGSES